MAQKVVDNVRVALLNRQCSAKVEEHINAFVECFWEQLGREDWS